MSTPKRVALTVVSLMGVLTIPRSLRADIVIVDFSGTYFERNNPDITGTFDGSLTFNNITGTLILGGVTTFAGGVICTVGTSRCSFADGVINLSVGLPLFPENFFFVEETPLVGATELTPMQISGIYGGFRNNNPFMPVDISFSSITYTSQVPEPSAVLLLATGLMFLFLRAVLRSRPRWKNPNHIRYI